MTRINIELDDKLHKEAKVNSASQDKTLIEYISEAIKEKLAREKKKL